MTRSRPVYASALTANEIFKLRYPRYLKGAVLAAVALVALFVWLWPGYQAKPYKLRQKEEMFWVDTAPPTSIPDPPKVQDVPRIPPVIEAADPDETDLIEPDWASRLVNIPVGPIVDPVIDDTGFVASSALPQLVFQAKADYPEMARRSGIEGTVVVKALVGLNGNVNAVEVMQSVHPLLDRAALGAALKCRFTPGKQRDFPVEAMVAIPYRFRLR